MTDPQSILGGVAATLQLCSTVASVIKRVKDAISERHRLFIQINATAILYQSLKDYAKVGGDRWRKTIQTLHESGYGPVDQFQASLRYLQTKLTSEKHGGFHDFAHSCHTSTPTVHAKS